MLAFITSYTVGHNQIKLTSLKWKYIKTYQGSIFQSHLYDLDILYLWFSLKCIFSPPFNIHQNSLPLSFRLYLFVFIFQVSSNGIDTHTPHTHICVCIWLSLKHKTVLRDESFGSEQTSTMKLSFYVHSLWLWERLHYSACVNLLWLETSQDSYKQYSFKSFIKC